jgi:hypothetical protein
MWKRNAPSILPHIVPVNQPENPDPDVIITFNFTHADSQLHLSNFKFRDWFVCRLLASFSAYTLVWEVLEDIAFLTVVGADPSDCKTEEWTAMFRN